MTKSWIAAIAALGLLAACSDGAGAPRARRSGPAPYACSLLLTSEAAELLGVPSENLAKPDTSEPEVCDFETRSELPDDQHAELRIYVADDAHAEPDETYDAQKADLRTTPTFEPAKGLGDDAYYAGDTLTVRSGTLWFEVMVLGPRDWRPVDEDRLTSGLAAEAKKRVFERERRLAEMILDRL